jgi:hypothetical protein
MDSRYKDWELIGGGLVTSDVSSDDFGHEIKLVGRIVVRHGGSAFF